MQVVLFCHSLISDWNHGNAHFLRGLVGELLSLGHSVRVFEPEDAWSVQNLIADAGELPLAELRRVYPWLSSTRYGRAQLDLEMALDGADLVLVHEWNEPALIATLGTGRKAPGASFKLLFHDTHHRGVTDPAAMSALDLSGYDGVLAFGAALAERYRKAGWARRVWTFHEAADVRVFRPHPELARTKDLVWIGNWGDDERTQELSEFLFEPVRKLGLNGTVYGVRYPEAAVSAVLESGLCFGGWLPNFRAPEVFAAHRFTVHVPRRPYAEQLPGIPTIRVFEALACGIPLISAPWNDLEGLFREGDFLKVENGAGMRRALELLANDPQARAEVSARGRETVLARHTCAHRASDLLQIARELGVADTIKRARATGRAEATRWD